MSYHGVVFLCRYVIKTYNVLILLFYMHIYLDLIVEPAPPGGIFGTMVFLYLMVCSIQKKMMAQFYLGFIELWTFKIRYHLKHCHFLYS